VRHPREFWLQPSTAGQETSVGPLGSQSVSNPENDIYGVIQGNPSVTSASGLTAYYWQQVQFSASGTDLADPYGLASAEWPSIPATCQPTGYVWDLGKRTNLTTGTIVKVRPAGYTDDASGYEQWLIEAVGGGFPADLCGNAPGDITKIPGYVAGVQQFLGHTVNNCWHWFSVNPCISGSGSGSGSGGGQTVACCPGVTVPNTLYVSGSNGVNRTVIYIGTDANGPYWQISSVDNSYQVRCRTDSGNVWQLSPGGAAISVTGSCNPLSLSGIDGGGVTWTVTE
jgi:hypothetical protein